MNARRIWSLIVAQLAGKAYAGPTRWPAALTRLVKASDQSPIEALAALQLEARDAA